MPRHKYRIGQVVDFNPSPRIGMAATSRQYKILRLLPIERGENLYRIKTISEPYERIAKESELVPGPAI